MPGRSQRMSALPAYSGTEMTRRNDITRQFGQIVAQASAAIAGIGRDLDVSPVDHRARSPGPTTNPASCDRAQRSRFRLAHRLTDMSDDDELDQRDPSGGLGRSPTV